MKTPLEIIDEMIESLVKFQTKDRVQFSIREAIMDSLHIAKERIEKECLISKK